MDPLHRYFAFTFVLFASSVPTRDCKFLVLASSGALRGFLSMMMCRMDCTATRNTAVRVQVDVYW